MRSTLTIRNFKRIEDTVRLIADSTVNYLVGENGSGKSSILNAISYLGDPRDASNSRHFFRQESEVNIELSFAENVKTNFLSWNEENPNKVDPHFNTQIQLLLDDPAPEMGANGVYNNILDYSNLSKEQFEFLNNTLSLLELPLLEARRIANDDAWNTDAGRRGYFQNNIEVNPYMLASGFKVFNSILRHMNELKRFANRPDLPCIIIIEEPENNLHPNLQKKVPIFIKNFLQTLSEQDKEKTQIFISTHSTSIISAAAALPDQKVYIMKDGMLVDLELNTVSESIGYRGHECAWVIGQMLGVQVTDIGYPENYCIVEEYSLQVLLESGIEKGYLKNFQFVSASGESNVVKLSERMDDMLKMNTLIKCNPYYSDKYYIIVDSWESFNNKSKGRFEKIKDKLVDRFITLTEDSIEEYYKDFSNETYSEFLLEFNQCNGERECEGKVKANSARHISELVNNKEDFSRLFRGELNFLIKE